MSYPKWLYRTPSTARGMEAFVVHDNKLYMGKSDDLYRVDSWCEENDQLVATITKVVELPGAPSGIWSMCTSQGLIWFSINIDLYSYDPDSGTLGGPWTLPIDGQVPYILDIIEYDGAIHVLDQCWNKPSVGNEHRIRRFSGGVFTELAMDAAGIAGQRLEVFQGLLYWACNNRLKTWDGSTAATVYSFTYIYPGGPFESVGALYNRDDEELYVGMGGVPFFVAGEKPQLYSWDGSAMTFVVTIDPSRSAHPRAFAFRANNELYAWCYDGSSRRDIFLVDPVAATSAVDDSASGDNVGKPLIYWPSDDTVWAGHSKTKVFSKNLCRVPSGVRFFLA